MSIPTPWYNCTPRTCERRGSRQEVLNNHPGAKAPLIFSPCLLRGPKWNRAEQRLQKHVPVRTKQNAHLFGHGRQRRPRVPLDAAALFFVAKIGVHGALPAAAAFAAPAPPSLRLIIRVGARRPIGGLSVPAAAAADSRLSPHLSGQGGTAFCDLSFRSLRRLARSGCVYREARTGGREQRDCHRVVRGGGGGPTKSLLGSTACALWETPQQNLAAVRVAFACDPASGGLAFVSCLEAQRNDQRLIYPTIHGSGFPELHRNQHQPREARLGRGGRDEFEGKA